MTSETARSLIAPMKVTPTDPGTLRKSSLGRLLVEASVPEAPESKKEVKSEKPRKS